MHVILKMSLSSRLKVLIGTIFILNMPSNAQEQIIIDSWRNASLWFDGKAYHKDDLKYWAVGGAAMAVAFNWDLEIQSSLQISNPRLQSTLSSTLEPFGNPIYMGSAGVLGYLGGHLFENEELKTVSSIALQSMFTSGVAVMALKLAFHRVRPEEQFSLDPYVFYGPSFKRNNLSFPSGHSVIAFSAASSISEYYHNKWYVAVSLYSIASLTAWQRVFDQKHWPSDVITGALIGIFIGRKIAQWQKGNKRQVSVQPLCGAVTGLSFQLQLD